KIRQAVLDLLDTALGARCWWRGRGGRVRIIPASLGRCGTGCYSVGGDYSVSVELPDSRRALAGSSTAAYPLALSVEIVTVVYAAVSGATIADLGIREIG